MTTSGLRVIMRRLGKRAGISKVAPHAFRRGGATQAIEDGVPSRIVQLMGRWSDMEMVELYTLDLERRKLHAYSPVDRARKNTSKADL